MTRTLKPPTPVIVFDSLDTARNLKRRFRAYVSKRVEALCGDYDPDLENIAKIEGAIELYAAFGLFPLRGAASELAYRKVVHALIETKKPAGRFNIRLPRDRED